MSDWDQEDDYSDYYPLVGGIVGGLSGRLIGRKLAGEREPRIGKKGSRKKASRKRVYTQKDLRINTAGIAGGGLGAGTGYMVGKAADDPESVRDTLENVIAAREKARSGLRELTSTPDRQRMTAIGLEALGAGAGAVGVSKLFGRIVKDAKADMRHFEKTGKNLKQKTVRKGLREGLPYYAVSGAANGAGLMLMPPRRRQ